MAKKEATALDSLTAVQRERLAKLTSEISYEKVTVSFSIEERNPQWGKRSAFYSVTVGRDRGETPEEAAGWAQEDLKVVRSLLCKHVVAATYDDAVKRRILTKDQARNECMDILGLYDAQIAKHLGNAEQLAQEPSHSDFKTAVAKQINELNGAPV
jgi:hypothetical protein